MTYLCRSLTIVFWLADRSSPTQTSKSYKRTYFKISQTAVSRVFFAFLSFFEVNQALIPMGRFCHLTLSRLDRARPGPLVIGSGSGLVSR